MPTPLEVARRLLSLARVQRGDTVVDLGCGDGRLLNLAVHEFGAARAIGYELDDELVSEARAKASGCDRIEVRNDDVANAEAALADADVVTLYLSNTGNAQLHPLLARTLRPTARVVSYVWEMPVAASRTVLMPGSGAPLHLFERADL